MSNLVDLYRDVVFNRHDPRTNDWFLVARPGSIMMILVSYVYFCKYGGPKYMKDKKPYQMKNTMMIYNISQILFNFYIFYEGLMSGWLTDYSYTCQYVDESLDPKALRMARAVHLYFLCKLIELLDTVLFVLRKKKRQISVLHVYHHSLMPIAGWIAIRFFPGGHSTLIGLINTFIHVIMYTYYLLSSFGPKMQKYLWWKRYLTLLQVAQFIIVFFHNGQLFFNGCTPYPKIITILLTFNTGLFTYLFTSFYVQNYNTDKRETKMNSTNGRFKTTTGSNDKTE